MTCSARGVKDAENMFLFLKTLLRIDTT